MTDGAETLLEQGETALASGDWATAATCYRALLDAEDRPDAHLGLATALWWMGDIRGALRAWNATYAAFCRAGMRAEAVLAAINLAIYYDTHIGNHTVASGWLRRAARHAEAVDDPLVDAWAGWAEAAVNADRARAVELAEAARLVAIDHGDKDLEICSLSVAGWGLVGLGRADEGVSLLDEAMAAAVGGECDQLDTVVLTSCLLMQACRDCADFERILHWVRAIEDFVERYGCPYLNATCRTHYGEVLAALGDWERADRELQHAMGLATHSLPAVRAVAAACLADLRISQGRLGDARQLLSGLEDLGPVSIAVARLALAEGAAEAAAAVVTRQLARSSDEQVQSAQLRELLGEIHLLRGDLDGAGEIAAALTEQGHLLGCDIIVCRASRLQGRTEAAAGEREEARSHLESALAGFAELGLVVDVARTRMALAQLLADDQPDLAVTEARSALATFERLGAAPEAEAAARWLRSLGARPPDGPDRALAALTRREVEVLALVREGLSNPEIAEHLYLSRRTVEHHVASILSKLGLRNRTEVAAFASQIG